VQVPASTNEIAPVDESTVQIVVVELEYDFGSASSFEAVAFAVGFVPTLKAYDEANAPADSARVSVRESLFEVVNESVEPLSSTEPSEFSA
jgi:hypothetical protein